MCGPGTKKNVVFKENFEDGLHGWTRDGFNVFGGRTFPWKAVNTADLEGDLADFVKTRDSRVAYGPAPDAGDCSGTPSDISSVDTVTSKPIVLPGSRQKAPRLSFKHYVATGIGYDGGNVKISVNNGGFEVIPASAYVFNAPTEIASEAEGNTNPLAGEDGFTGTDGGEVGGSWGQSQVNLAELGVGSGDIVELRFDVGRDGCGGIDGWYVDDVTVSTCKAKAKATGVHRPQPSTFGRTSRVHVTVDGDGVVGTPTGTVTLTKASGRSFGAKRLSGGKATFVLPKDLGVARHRMVVTYKGNDTWAMDRGGLVARVVRRR